MDKLRIILDDTKNRRITLARAGLATCARLAADAVAHGRPAVLVAYDAESWHESFALARLFSPALSADPYPVGQPVWQRTLLGFPDLRQWHDGDGWAERLASLYALSLGAPRLIVTGLQGLLLKYVPIDFFAGHYLELSRGQDLSPELIIGQLVEWGYERVAMVTRPGELASRGDILDVFAPGYQKPARIEFFGDNIDDMRLFDGETQRGLEPLDGLTLIPARPVSLENSDLKKMKKRLDGLRAEGRLNENDAYSLKKKLDEGASGILPGVLFDKATLFEDWLPKDALWILPGEADAADGLLARRLSLKEDLEDEESPLRQPAALSLRPRSAPAPWNSFQCVCAEQLHMGVEERGQSFPERDFHQFSDLFPLPEEKDRPWQTMVRAIKTWRQEYGSVIFSFSTDRGRKKFLKLAEQDGIFPRLRLSGTETGLFALISPFRSGAELLWDKTLVLGEDIIYPRAEKHANRASRAFKGLDDFENLKPGDLLVHRDYGIGRFAGLNHLSITGAENDFLLLEYSGGDKLYVPVDRLALIQRFKGQEGVMPVVDRLGTQSWVNGREKARKAIEKIAADLVEMYAYRKVAKSFRYDPPGDLYHEFEATFGFEETPDQARAIQDVLDDMDREAPMDRLICGDVGFGKTEVALRAAFRAAAEGRQVALLCPTTVLAEQHYQTFRSRLAGFPVNVGLLSRFVPRGKQKEVLNACERGQIDILIGTHRILSSDVRLPNLALLILDEEQRFGVRHKEKLKALKKNVDVLTLTATPIPRTLQLSMSGIRDLSIIETAPVDRKPVASAVIQRDDKMLREVVERELARQGQVFWVYNRVHDLERVVEYVKKLVPNARVGMAHGQMGEKELEETMRDFWHGEIDVLVSTSIVESGLDFPRANTLIVDQAQMFGLGQLYQLRGRVGRSDRQAYAYFVVPDTKRLTDVARERLRIIMNMDYLGAGFQVAMEDLRLRGAGNILGEVQSGHMSRVGLDLYLDMLEEEVRKLKGLPQPPPETEINLGVAAHIPGDYITDGRERLRYYKSLTAAADGQARESIAMEIRDRFGHFPPEFRNFLAVLDFKQFLASLQVERADLHPDSIRLNWREDQTAIQPARIVKLIETHPEIRLSPPATLALPLPEGDSFPDALAMARETLSGLADS